MELPGSTNGFNLMETGINVEGVLQSLPGFLDSW